MEQGTDKLLQPTFAVTSDDLRWMVLDRHQLPSELAGFELLNERELDNEIMATHGFAGRTAESLRAMGRVTGYARSFAVTQGAPTLAEEPADILEAATVVHLFDRPEQVRRWIDEVFVGEFQQRVGKEEASGNRMIGVEVLDVSGFHDHSAELLAVHEVPGGILASTIVDFQLGRLLGVAYVVTKEDKALPGLARDLGLRLEKQMVRVVLGAA